jgi:hypothetical protein
MASVTITGARRRGDDVFVEGDVDGVSIRAHLWWSHLAPLTAAQRRAAAAQVMAANAAAQAEIDVAISGTVTV